MKHDRHGSFSDVDARDQGTPELQGRRRMLANDKSTNETWDTIGQIWCQGLIEPPNNCPVTSIEMRDAARAYRRLYWRQYGFLVPKAGVMTGKVDIVGVKPTVIEDFDGDVLSSERLATMYMALNNAGQNARRMTEQACIDNQGVIPPRWWSEHIDGYPAATGSLRDDLSIIARRLLKARQNRANAGYSRNNGIRSLRQQEQALEAEIARVQKLKFAAMKPNLDALRIGLIELAKTNKLFKRK